MLYAGGRRKERRIDKGERRWGNTKIPFVGGNFFLNEGKTAQTERKRSGSMSLGFLKMDAVKSKRQIGLADLY
jgi:hypothetical protein